MVSRRDFIKTSGALSAGMMLGARWQVAHAYSQSGNLANFVAPLRDVTAGGIPVATSDGPINYATGTAAHYSVTLEQFEDQLHPALPNPTRVWGYRASNTRAGANKHLGAIIVANRDAPVQITATNALPPAHIIPVDRTIMGAGGPAMGEPDN